MSPIAPLPSPADVVLSRRRWLMAAATLAVTPLPASAQGGLDRLAAEVANLYAPTATPDTRRRFHESRLSNAGQRRAPWPSFERVHGRIAEISGGLDVVGVSAQGTTVWLRLRSRRQGVVRNLRVRIDRDQTSHVFDLSASPQPTPYAGPLVQGPLDRAELAHLIEQRIRHAADLDEFSGSVRVVAPDGELVHAAAYGFADRTEGRSNDSGTRFNLGSADKSFTALMIARLVSEGRTTWDTRLVDVLPGYPLRSFAEAVTLRHLASHVSGLGMLFDRPGWRAPAAGTSMIELLDQFAAIGPAFPPGRGAAYSNEGYILLGAVVEALTGHRWHELLQAWIYAPAGMSRSGHLPYSAVLPDVARGYRYLETDPLGLLPRQDNGDFLKALGAEGNSSGGGYSTPADMVAYLQGLRAGRLVSLDVVEPMLQAAAPGIGEYGLGFVVRPVAGRRLVGHDGSGIHSGIDGMSQIVWETGWAFSILGNYDSPFAKTIAQDLGDWLAVQEPEGASGV